MVLQQDEQMKEIIRINCKNEINNAEIDNAKDIDIVMPMYNLIEYSDNYSKKSARLWQYYKNEPNNNLPDSESLKTKLKITGNTSDDGNAKDIEIVVPLKYLCNFWKTLEMPLINFEFNLILAWSSTCVITNSTDAGGFAVTDTKLYVPLSFENEDDTTSLSEYYLPKVEITDYTAMIDGKNVFDQPINNDFKTYGNIRKIGTGKGDDYTTDCFLDYPYFKENCKTIAIDLSK